ncbi:MAG: 6-phosphogluconolactonase [Acidobacteria bacterium]|nr:6-phosphogluconolactonase [Acidobacteriota bacterium]
MREVKILQNISEISRVAAEKFITIGGEAINQNGKFTVALAGGSTPKSLYQLKKSPEIMKKQSKNFLV